MAMNARRTPGPSGVRTRQPRHAVGGVLQAAALTAVLALTPVACSDGDSDNQADPAPPPVLPRLTRPQRTPPPTLAWSERPRSARAGRCRP